MTNERGVALPLALFIVMMLTSLMLAFAVLARTEPEIAGNHLRAAQARSFAEAGVERAMWALDNGANFSGAPNTIPVPMILTSPGTADMPAQAPWDGNTFLSLGGNGGALVAVRNDQSGANDANVREITAVGWTPTNDPAVNVTKAHRRVFVRVRRVANPSAHAPCALCVKGSLSVGGNAIINGTNVDPACGGNNKFGTFTQNSTTTSGNPTITGGAGGIAQNQGPAAFNDFLYSQHALDVLKEAAKKNGTYFGPGYPNGGFTNNGSSTWTGVVAFDSYNKVGNGIVFVDTIDGVNLDPAQVTAATATLATVSVNGNPFTGFPPNGTTLPNVPTSDTPGVFSGVIVVNGALSISGNMQIHGLVYATNDLVYNGTGTGGIYGQVISANYRDTSSTSIDSTTGGNSKVVFDCQNARGFNMIPPGFSLIAGSYREQED